MNINLKKFEEVLNLKLRKGVLNKKFNQEFRAEMCKKKTPVSLKLGIN